MEGGESPLCQRGVAQLPGVAASRQVQVQRRRVQRREGAPSRHRVELRAQCSGETQGFLHPVIRGGDSVHSVCLGSKYQYLVQVKVQIELLDSSKRKYRF